MRVRIASTYRSCQLVGDARMWCDARLARMADTHRTSLANILVFIANCGCINAWRLSNVSYLLGREAGVTMLVLLLTCKLLEMHAKRDLFVVLFLSFFLLLSSFFYQQTIASALFALFATTLLLTAQVAFQYTGLVPSLKQKFKLIGTLIAFAIPLTLCAFLLFPRIQGPLWGLPNDAHNGRSGLSDTMAPGGISNLVLSEEIAFRAKFDQPIANKSLLYWRGVVMTDFDGKTWRPVPTDSSKPSAELDFSGKTIKQEIILEPQGQRWMFALDLP